MSYKKSNKHKKLKPLYSSSTESFTSNSNNFDEGNYNLVSSSSINNLQLNPLEVFPSKKDNITKAFFGIEIDKHKRKVEDNIRWLYVDKVDSNFGLQGNTQDDSIKRAYRRIESSTLFNPVQQKDVSLSNIAPIINPNKNYIVIEESRLQELTKLESKLKKEKQLLGEQCEWALSDIQIKANIPIPATRLALYSLCESQLKKIEYDYIKLNENWNVFCKQNHYNQNHLFMKNSYINNAPISQRAMKLRLVRDAVFIWKTRKDRDQMLFEDDLSYLMGKYYEAKIRQIDYERYYILAARYGPYQEMEFNKDSRPGKRYYIQVTTGAIKFQMLWDRYWAMTKLRRFRAARMIQKHYRRRYYYRKYHPIIMIRLKIGKKTYYMFCFNLWKEYNKICRKIKDAIHFHRTDCITKHWQAMKLYLQTERNGRLDKARMLLVRTYNAGIYSKFIRWVQYVKGNKKLKVRLRRLFGFPHFDIWCEYISKCKREKLFIRSIIKIQALFRCYRVRIRFLKKKTAQKKLREFSLIVLSFIKVRSIRKTKIYQEFLEWEPSETQRRSIRANDIERQRLLKRQQYIQEKEKKALNKVKQHLKSPDGKIQVKEMMKSSYSWIYLDTIMKKFSLYKNISTLSKSEKVAYCSKALLTECSYVTRLLEAHNFDTKYVPYLVCPDINCHAIFTTEHQYHHHMKESIVHNDISTSPQFTHFHMLLKHYKGIECLRSYLIKSNGISGLVNVLDAWITIQEWKKIPTTHENYETKAMNILELYLLEDSPRKIDILSLLPSYHTMLHQLNTVKYKEFQGNYKLMTSTANMLENILGWKGKEFYHYSTEEILLPDIFANLEWICFMNLFNILDNSIEFKESNEYKTYKEILDKDSKQRYDEYIQLYENYRKLKIEQWTRRFIDTEKIISLKALDIVNLVMEKEIYGTMYRNIEKQEVYLRSLEIKHTEQANYEYNSLIIDDAIFFSETNILDSIYDLYTVSLLDTMLKIPELRKGMLQYAGYLKTTSRHLQINTNNNTMGNDKKNEEWYQNFFHQTKAIENQQIQNDSQLVNNNLNQRHFNHVINIQRRIRGYLGRKKARKIFIKLYVKKIDPTTGLYYYSNIKTGQATWIRPAITKYLLPQTSSW